MLLTIYHGYHHSYTLSCFGDQGGKTLEHYFSTVSSSPGEIVKKQVLVQKVWSGA